MIAAILLMFAAQEAPVPAPAPTATPAPKKKGVRDGLSKETAFKVKNVHEEYVMVAKLGYPAPESQSLVGGEGGKYYDVLTTKDPATGKPIDLWFDITSFF